MSLIKKELLKMIPRLRRYTYSLTGSSDRGDDLLQDSIVKILSIQNESSIENFNAYFYKIISNGWKDTLKKKKIDTTPIDEYSNYIPSQDIDIQEGIETRQQSKKLQAIINLLSDNLKTTFLLSTVEEKSYKEISEILNIPLGTVMSRLNEARKQLKKLAHKEELQ